MVEQKEIAISLACRLEIENDLRNGEFYYSDNQGCYKCYKDEENGLLIDVNSEYIEWAGYWELNVLITSDFGDDYNLEEGQWQILNKAFEDYLYWHENELQSEAKHISYLQNRCNYQISL